MRGNKVSEQFSNIVHFLALAGIIADNEQHRAADLEECKRQWAADLRAELTRMPCEVSIQNLALLYLFEMLSDSPIAPKAPRVKLCQN